MKRYLSLLAIGLISTNVGCTYCTNCDDYSYGAFGGVWERTDATYGRVGSAFSPAGFSHAEDVSNTDNSENPAPDSAEPIAPPAPQPPMSEAPYSEVDEDSLIET